MKVQDLLSTPDRWTQGALARSAGGDPVDPLSEDAVAWCLVGAIMRCYSHSQLEVEVIVPSNLRLNEWNDQRDRTWQDVIHLVKHLGI